MIYLKNITDAQVLFIPRNGESETTGLSLVVRNTTDHTDFSVPVVDLNTSGLYFNLAVVLPEDIADGEYEYNLMRGLVKVSCGLLFIGDLKSPNQYEKTITYKQYESE